MAAVHQPDILVTMGWDAPLATPLRTPDGREFYRAPPLFVRDEHLSVIGLAETLGSVPPLSGGIAGWPAWFASAWLEVRRLMDLRTKVQEADRG